MSAVAGFGFRAGATPSSLQAALAQALAQAEGDGAPLTLLATVQDKADAPCLQALAAQLGVPVCGVAPAQIEAAPTLTHSQAVHARRGTGSVAEAAALAAAGPGAKLLHPRSVSPDRLATCALATVALPHPHPGDPICMEFPATTR